MMRILQIIDSLETGGAERMAVNYANALVKKIPFSGLVATRKEGLLLHQIHPEVAYLFLNKKNKLDGKALFVLRKFVVKNKVTHIHAHSTSFFLAFLLKLTCPFLVLIRHDHYGNNEFLESRPYLVLRLTAFFFNGVIAVNQKLKNWSVAKLKSQNVIYFPNFAVIDNAIAEPTVLNGIVGKRILCLANLREQKNHLLLLEVAKKMKISHPDWTFHLIGKDFEDAYSEAVKSVVMAFGLEKNVFFYGAKQNVKLLLEQADIAVLSSKSEGLPVALLEYGLHKKAVVVTAVGEVSMIVQDQKNGFLIQTNQSELFYNAVVKLADNKQLQTEFGAALYETILANYSEKSVLNNYLNWLKKI